MTENDDLSQIIAGCKNKDNSSFKKLVDQYSNRLYGYFYRMTNNKAVSEDLLSELFLKLVEKIKTYRGGNFDSWIFTIASNLFHDFLRNKQRNQMMMATHKETMEDEIRGHKTTDMEPTNLLQERLALLDTDTRDIIMLRFYSDMSFKEIASVRNEPIGTTLSRLHRGLKKLRQDLGA